MADANPNNDDDGDDNSQSAANEFLEENSGDEENNDSEIEIEKDDDSKNDDENENDDSSDSDSDGSSTRSDTDSESNSDNDDDDDDDDDEKPKDGLSDYERLRLERIKRNQERLAALGLQGASLVGPQQKKAKRKKSNPQNKTQSSIEPRRTQRSRSSKKRIDYAQQPAFYIQDDASKKSSSKKADEHLTEEERAAKLRKQERRRKERRHAERVPRFVYDELQRIRSKRKAGAKTAKRHKTKAEREHKHWKKVLQKLLNQQENQEIALQKEREQSERQQEALRQEQAERDELDCKGLTKLELLKEIESRTPELVTIVSGHDNVQAENIRQYQEKLKEQEEAEKNGARERKLEIMEALNRFTKVYNGSVTKLNRLLYARSPKDKPKPRESVRRSFDTAFADAKQESEPKVKAMKKNSKGGEKKGKGDKVLYVQPPKKKQKLILNVVASATTEQNAGQQSTTKEAKPRIKFSLGKKQISTPADTSTTAFENSIAHIKKTKKRGRSAMALPIHREREEKKSGSSRPKKAPASIWKKLPAPSTSNDQVPANTSRKKTKKAKEPRFVGGWISPKFSEELDRKWLERTKPLDTKPAVVVPDAVAAEMGISAKKTAVFDLASYVPQVGDIVLYYPSAHRDVLNHYPDLHGSRRKNLLRVPLWARANRDRNRMGKKGEDLKVWWTDEWMESLLTVKKTKKEEKPEAVGSNGKKKVNRDSDEIAQEASDTVCLGDYPIICRVERAYPEFPVDPYAKLKPTENPNETAGGGKGENMALPKQLGKTEKTMKKRAKTPPQILLAVLLKPLSPVVPPINDESSSPFNIELAPNFSVVTFPVGAPLEQFIIPFCWAYTSFHALKMGESIWIRRAVSKEPDRSRRKTDTGLCGKGSVLGFIDQAQANKKKQEKNPLPGVGAGSRFGGNKDDLKTLLETLMEDGIPNPVAIQKALDSGTTFGNLLPVREACVIVNFLYTIISAKDVTTDVSQTSSPVSKPNTSTEVVSLVGFILRTLPLRHGVTVSYDFNQSHLLKVSSWNLVTLQPSDLSRSLQNGLLGYLDYSINEKALACLKDTIHNNAHAHFFVPMVTERIAPAYYCAVPIGMSLDRILARLKVNATTGSCYYTSIESILMDLRLISGNCMLYNNPDSELVVHCIDIIAQCQQRIKNIIQNSTTKGNEKLHEEDFAGKKPTPGFQPHLNTPFKGTINCEWLQQYLPYAPSEGFATITRKTSSLTWIPQSGDSILYSRSNHSRFVKAHFDCLDESQCSVPEFQKATNNSKTLDHQNQQDDDFLSKCSLQWIEGTVISVRTSFPKNILKKTMGSFETTTPILFVEIRFHYSHCDENSFVYWRPCLVPTHEGKKCRVCGLSQESFLKPAWMPTDGMMIVPTNSPRIEAEYPLSLTEDIRTSIGNCFALLKQRCIDGIPPNTLNPHIALDNAKFGVTRDLNSYSLPSYEDFFSSIETKYEKRYAKKSGHTSKIKCLSEVGYMPIWSLDALQHDNGNCTPRHSMWMSFPCLCLELVRLRISNGYYRSLSAVINDISESYVASVLFLLSEPATRDTGRVSIREITKYLMSPKRNGKMSRISVKKKSENNNSENEVQTKKSEPVVPDKSRSKEIEDEEWASEKFSEEEQNIIQRIAHIRDFHTSAMVFALQSDAVEKIFCLKPMVEPAQEQDPIQAISSSTNANLSPEQSENISKIRNLLQAVGRKSYSKRFKFAYRNEYKIKIKCDNHIITETGQLESGTDEKSVIIFGLDDFKNNEKLAQSLFGRPGRMQPCARCQCYGRSMLSCRVRRCHSAPDYNLVENFKGTLGVDSLLVPWNQGREDDTAQMRIHKSDGEVVRPNPTEGDSNPEGPGGKETENRELAATLKKEIDEAKENLSIADEALKLAVNLQAKSILLLDLEVKLSEEFISTNFPVDDEDNHYTLCIHCGCAGDLMICDGCANVSHPHCAGLSEVPEGDWFCHKCLAKQIVVSESGSKPGTTEDQMTSVQDNNSDEKSPTKIVVSSIRTDKNTNENVKEGESEKDASTLITIETKKEGNVSAKHPIFSREQCRLFNDDDFDAKESELDKMLTKLVGKRPSHKSKPKETKEAKVDAMKHQSVEDPLDALGSTWVREFLSFISIESAEELLNMKSSLIAQDLELWRKEKGMKPLKGKGSISTVSTWKNIVRKAGARVSGADCNDSGTGAEQLCTVLQSLTSQGRKFCSSIGIKNAEVFLETKSKELADKYAEWRKVEKMPVLQGTGTSAYIATWKSKLRQELEAANKDSSTSILPSDVHIPKGFRVRKLFEDGNYYEGKVISGPTKVLDEENGRLAMCWRVKYLDDDEEEFSIEELDMWAMNKPIRDETKAVDSNQSKTNRTNKNQSTSNAAEKEDHSVNKGNGNNIGKEDDPKASSAPTSTEPSNTNSTRSRRRSSKNSKDEDKADAKTRTVETRRRRSTRRESQEGKEKTSSIETSNPGRITKTSDAVKEESIIESKKERGFRRRGARGGIRSKVEECEEARQHFLL